MKRPYFHVMAICDNPKCETHEFSVDRKKAETKSNIGHVNPISRVVCPDCRMWGHVQNIVAVE